MADEDTQQAQPEEHVPLEQDLGPSMIVDGWTIKVGMNIGPDGTKQYDLVQIPLSVGPDGVPSAQGMVKLGTFEGEMQAGVFNRFHEAALELIVQQQAILAQQQRTGPKIVLAGPNDIPPPQGRIGRA